MAKKIVTLYIDDTSCRLLITDGMRIRRWAELPLEPGLVRAATVLNSGEVASRIKQLLEANKVKTKRVVIGLSGLYCLTRPIALPQLPKAMVAEAVMREARKILPVPLEQLYLSWQTIPASDGKMQAFAVGIPRRMADVLLKTLQGIGLTPYFMDLKPLSLSKIVGQRTAIVVDVQPTEFDIVIMSAGIPHPIRTVLFPSEALTWQQKLPMIRDDLDRTIKFYNANNAENPLSASVPIYVSGELAHESGLREALSHELGHPAVSLPLPFELPEGLDESRCAFNLALAYETLTGEKRDSSQILGLNVLPTAYQPKPISLVRVFGLPGVVIALGLLVYLTTLLQGASANIAATRSQLAIGSQLFEQKQKEQKELMGRITTLEKKIAEAEATQRNFTKVLQRLEKWGGKLNSVLGVTQRAIPSDLSLTNVGYAGNTLTISGKSQSESGVLTYARGLDGSGEFSEVFVTSLKKSSKGVDFALFLKVKE